MDWGLPVAGNCKLGICLLVVAAACADSAWGQSARGDGQAPIRSQESRNGAASAADAVGGPDVCCPDDACECEQPFTFRDWMASHPLRSLWSGCSAATREVPWSNWSARPLSIGAFAGAMVGGPMISDWVGSTSGFDGGWRFGWDVTPAWGTEMRFAFGSLGLCDTARAERALAALDDANGIPAADPRRLRNDNRVMQVFQWDVEVLYYPWRETRLRPYFLVGIGLTSENFVDRVSVSYQSNCLSLPLGIGLKYLYDENFAVRLDLLDDIAMSNEHLQTQNNISLTAGVEMRFGGSRKVYWPFDLSR